MSPVGNVIEYERKHAMTLEEIPFKIHEGAKYLTYDDVRRNAALTQYIREFHAETPERHAMLVVHARRGAERMTRLIGAIVISAAIALFMGYVGLIAGLLIVVTIGAVGGDAALLIGTTAGLAAGVAGTIAFQALRCDEAST